jgi:pyruvate formate lyase activating enzyme
MPPDPPKSAISGLIFHVMRFSLYDGPGIRTTVFLKGCPLNCWWCHNPESQAYLPDVMYTSGRCIRCGDCIAACQSHALRWEDGPLRDQALCVLCGECAEACPADARQLLGRRMSVPELMQRLRRDLVFYEESGGGVTFSGGEPLQQPEFLEAALVACRKEGLHTAVDTCGYASEAVLRRIIRHADLFLYDLKVLDETRHRQFAGVSNEPILRNLALLAREHGTVIVRIPVVPGVNEDDANLGENFRFLSSLGLRRVDLLPDHPAGIEKYHRLGIEYPLHDAKTPSHERLEEVAARYRDQGFEIRIGG